jgi:hypothetical protein
MARILLLAITFAALSLSTIGVRADGTWCAHYGTGLEGTNCGFLLGMPRSALGNDPREHSSTIFPTGRGSAASSVSIGSSGISEGARLGNASSSSRDLRDTAR